jgi:hypothetical protein
MIKVGIVGSFSAINRHANALNNFQGIRIAGSWISHGVHESALNIDTGLTCAETDKIIGQVDALIITDAGSFCNHLVIAALRNARHVFLYPSVVRSVNEAFQLIKLAREANTTLFCGRTGNTNILGLIKALPDITAISMIELQHYYKITGSGKSGHVSEALLSDIEIISNLVHARTISIKAKGLCMLSSYPEIINARLEFDNGCAVNYNCNLVAAQNEFIITIVAMNRILKYNFITNEFTGWQLHRTLNQNESPIFVENIHVEQTDPLSGDLSDFFKFIQSGPALHSINDNGFESYIMTDRILEKVRKTLIQCA